MDPPPSFRHQRIVSALARQIESKLGGDTGSYALWTPSGIRFPDTCWAPNFETNARIRYFTTSGEQRDSKFGLELVLPPGTYPL